jgi:hypothetical protein
MSSTTITDYLAGTAETTTREVWLRRTLILFSAVSALFLSIHLVVLFWAQNEFTQPESIVAVQSTMLARSGTLYHNLQQYPFTVSAYMPIFYGLEAGLIKLGAPVFPAGRMVSFAALLGIFVLAWRLIMLYTGDRYCAWTATLLTASTSVLLSWGTVAQVDTLAVFCAMCAFYHYSRYRLLQEPSLRFAFIFAVLALLVKQTVIAAPIAICLSLWFENRRLALRFAAALAAVLLVSLLGFNFILNGRLLDNTVFANLNPFAFEKVGQHVRYLLIAAGQLTLIAALGARQVLQGPGKVLFLYLGLAATALALTAPKIGSDSNYQIESTILLILCACIALHSLRFFPAVLEGRKTWVTLLQLPLAIHLVLNYRITEPLLAARVAKEMGFRSQVATLSPFTGKAQRVLSTDINVLVHGKGSLEVEPLIYTLLVHAGRIDPEPVRRDLETRKFATVILYQDVNQPFDPDLELPTLPVAQIAEIRRNYKLVQHVPGPYLNGVFVYQPAGL